MIEIITDVRNSCDNPDLKDLNMRIGIHTGKIVAGIIGTKIVRYDIFGADVLIANKMESNGLAGKVVISEETKRQLLIIPECTQKFDFFTHKTVDLQGIHRTVESFIISTREDCSFVSNISISNDDNIEDEEEEKSDLEIKHQDSVEDLP
jgi:class 3 adenylate cyclase